MRRGGVCTDQRVLVTTSMSLITDHHLHRNSRYTTIRIRNMSYRQHLSAQTTQHRLLRCLEDPLHCASPHFSSDMAKRLLGAEDTRLRCLHNSSQQATLPKSRRQIRPKTGLDYLWINLCPRWLGTAPSLLKAVYRILPCIWLVNRPINHIHYPGL